MIEIDVTNRQAALQPDEARLREAARRVLAGEGIARATVSLVLVDDRSIRELNRRFLAHDYATDVLSFVLERTVDALEGEIVVSADTAAGAAPEYGWPPADELLLYVVHGALHLAGWDDATPEQAAAMRRRECHYLDELGVHPPQGPAGSGQTVRGVHGGEPAAEVLAAGGGQRKP